MAVTSLSAERVAALDDAVALIPSGAKVTTSNTAGAHLAARRSIYSAPVVLDASWALVDRADPWVARPDSPILHNEPRTVARYARRFEQDPRWRRVFARDGVVVFRRVEG